MDKILATVAVVLLVGFIAIAAYVGIERQEIEECNTWGLQAQEYDGYYLASWQKEQCESHGIQIKLQKDAN